jgi:hypothetical protein
LPLPCFEGLTSVWTGQELVVFVWASKDACGRVDAPEVCTVMAGWHPQTGWDIRGVVPDIRTAVWADDRVLAVTDQLRLIEVGSDATVTDLGAVSAPPSRDAEWIPRGLVLWGDNGGAGRLVAPDGAESILPLPPGAATVGDVIGLDGDIIALSLDDGGQLQAWLVSWVLSGRRRRRRLCRRPVPIPSNLRPPLSRWPARRSCPPTI